MVFGGIVLATLASLDPGEQPKLLRSLKINSYQPAACDSLTLEEKAATKCFDQTIAQFGKVLTHEVLFVAVD